MSFNVEQLPITLKDADSEDDVFNSWRSINSIDGDKITQITTIGNKTVYALFGGTEGLQYSLSSDGTYYSVSGYIGTLTDVVIGKRYNNKPVTAISGGAFENNTNIVSIKLSNTITSIGEDAFMCTGGIKAIGDYIANTANMAKASKYIKNLLSKELPLNLMVHMSLADYVSKMGSIDYYYCVHPSSKNFKRVDLRKV